MAELAIKGHPTRGAEVNALLEMLGGKNTYNYSTYCDSMCFHIGKDTNSIYYDWVRVCYEDGNTLVFTLEEFLEKYPYKVGDKVRFSDSNTPFTISRIWWDNNASELICTLEEQDIDVSSVDLQPYKEEKMEETIKIDIPKGYEFFGIDDGNKVVLTKKQFRYPKTYEECCKVLNYEPDRQTVTGYDAELIENVQTLKLCRDAYWKIAGEEMGLGKPWKPDYHEKSYEQGSPIKYVIYYTGTHITKEQKCTPSYILAFPTEEMRNAFLENFKELIEICKELL